MPQVFNPDGTRLGDASNALSVEGLINTLAVINPQITGVYGFSVANLPGVVAANNFLSIFVPGAASFNVIFAGAFISSTTISGSTETAPMRAWRTTAASAGTLVANSTVAKFISDYPTPGVELRTGNPTITLGGAIFSSPPAISATVGSTTVHQATPPTGGFGSFILQPGEGVVLRTDAGDVDQRWNLSLVWGETA